MKIHHRFMRLTALIAVIFLLINSSCKRKQELPGPPDPKFREFISAYTSGLVSVESTIKIRLANDYPKPVELNTEIQEKLFRFSPSIDGAAYWRDSRTLEFVPEGRLKANTIYTCEFLLSKILDVPSDMEKFVFGLQTLEQMFSVSVEGFSSYDMNNLKLNRISGMLVSSDVLNPEELKSLVQATQSGKSLPISWSQESDRRMHHFTIDSVLRSDEESLVNISWSGKKIDSRSEGKEDYTIPALGDFRLMSTKVIQQPEQYILLQFSDPLAKNQNLDGLIRFSNGVSLNFVIDGNTVKVYPAARQIGSIKFFVEEGIKNVMGYRFPKTQEIALAFEEVKPAVKLVGNGVILPNSQGLIFPFEAVNLRAVDVKIIQIYENNISQFLQTNSLDGSDQLKRVGRLVKKAEVALTSSLPIDYGAWNNFTLDLSTLIKQQPGAIYRIEISFRQKHSLYPCATEEKEEETSNEEEYYDEISEDEFSYWDSWEEYGSYYEGDYYYYGEDYDWDDYQRDKNDPCNKRYYHNRSVARNILASDLGIIAKGGSDRSMTFVVTDLRTTEPMSGVALEVYNYQKQIVAETKTDGNGMAKITTDSKPFLLIAKSGEQRGYLKLDDGSSLSLSSFDVYGSAVQKGIKGYIYGERGVWRPGDTLFLTFVLEDKQNLIPENHPVTFELVNPQGQLVKKMVSSSGSDGFYSFITSTSASAPTGNWTAQVKIGGTAFSKSLKIETVKPNRLKIKLDFGKEKLSVASPEVKGKMQVNWLHGAVARNLKTNVRVNLTQIPTRFEKYPEYIFDDPAREFSSEEQTIYDGNVDENGQAEISSDIAVSDAAPGMLSASFMTRVFEEGGDFSIDRYSIPYAPYNAFIGIRVPKGDKSRGMLLTDTNHVVQIVTLDPDGKALSLSGLDVKIYKVNWRWWWDRSGDELANYLSDSYHEPVFSTQVSTSGGKGSFTFRINYPEWGRYLIRVSDPDGGHATGKVVYIDWPGWAGNSTEKFSSSANMLVFFSDKEKYQAGENAVITFPSSEQGRALVSIESGSRVVDAMWVETKSKQTQFSFKITEEMAPNVYVNITLLQPHAQTANDLPIRMYGVIPIMVEDPGTILHPEITMSDVLQPEETFQVKVKEKDKKDMSYTIAVVDEGLLDLTRFQTPDLWSSFFAREALGVKTWDLYDMVLGAYGGKIEQLLSIGGDEEARSDGAKSKANRFKPVVMYLGPFQLSGGKTATHTLTMPRYVGSVRTMVVAGNGKAYGKTEKTTPVRKPLMVVATLPRVLGPGESVNLPVTVFAMENNIKNIEVEIKSNDLLIAEEGTTRSLSFSQPGDETVSFPFKVASKLGTGKVQAIVKSGKELAQYDIEIEIRTPNPPLTTFNETVIEAGKSWESNWQAPGIQGTNSSMLELSTLPPVDFGRRLKYLLSYPHGCVEQTTSTAFPQLFLEDVMDLKSTEKEKIKTHMLAAIERLKSFVRSDGGFGYWPGASESDDWASSYAGHYLLEAEAKGYSLPSGIKQSWLRYQKNAARDWSAERGRYQYYLYHQSDLQQAYRLYTLALANAAELGAMNRLRERKDLSNEAAWRLAAAYAKAGQPEAAKALIEKRIPEGMQYKGFSATYGSYDRDLAMILETLVLMGDKEKAFPIVKKLSEHLSGSYWMSTQSTAYSLLAISKFAGINKGSKGIQAEYSLNGSKTLNTSTNLSVIQVPIDSDKNPTGKVMVTNKGSSLLYARIINTGSPEAGDQTEISNGLSMNIVYTDMEGNSLDVSSLAQGTDFVAEIRIQHTGMMDHYSNLALTQIFPSGWEIRNTRMDAVSEQFQGDVPVYQDFRDDRVLTYFHLSRGYSKKFYVILNATYAGRFWLPAANCEAMYDGTIQARSAGMWVEVTK